jgi:hypothetical protein
VLAQNINRLMDQRYKESSNRPMALAKDAGVTLSTVQRTISRETGASIDTLEAFAKVFGLAPFQLLVPWGLLGEISVRERPTPTARHQPLFRGRDRVEHRPARTSKRRRIVR